MEGCFTFPWERGRFVFQMGGFIFKWGASVLMLGFVEKNHSMGGVPPPPDDGKPCLSAGGGFEPPIKFLKRGLDRTSTFREGGCWERGGDFFSGAGGCSFDTKTN